MVQLCKAHINSCAILSFYYHLNQLLQQLEVLDDDMGKCKIVYRHYATLYFVFVVDRQESDLGILDLIQVFVEVLDKCTTSASLISFSTVISVPLTYDNIFTLRFYEGILFFSRRSIE